MTKWTEDEVEFLKENASTMSSNDIADELGRTQSSVKHYARRHDISLEKPHSVYSDKISKSKRKYDFDEDFFSRNNSAAYYWAGALEADGCVRERGPNSHTIDMRISKKDRSWLEQFREALQAGHPIRKDRDFVSFKVHSNRMFEDLEDLGIVPRKTYKNITPDIPDQYVYDYIRGIFDGDGTICKKASKKWDAYKVGLVNSEAVCKWIDKKLDFSCSLYPDNQSVAWRLETADRENIKKFAVLIYDGAEYYMKRKHQRFIDYGMMGV